MAVRPEVRTAAAPPSEGGDDDGLRSSEGGEGSQQTSDKAAADSTAAADELEQMKFARQMQVRTGGRGGEGRAGGRGGSFEGASGGGEGCALGGRGPLNGGCRCVSRGEGREAWFLSPSWGSTGEGAHSLTPLEGRMQDTVSIFCPPISLDKMPPTLMLPPPSGGLHSHPDPAAHHRLGRERHRPPRCRRELRRCGRGRHGGRCTRVGRRGDGDDLAGPGHEPGHAPSPRHDSGTGERRGCGGRG